MTRLTSHIKSKQCHVTLPASVVWWWSLCSPVGGGKVAACSVPPPPTLMVTCDNHCTRWSTSSRPAFSPDPRVPGSLVPRAVPPPATLPRTVASHTPLATPTAPPYRRVSGHCGPTFLILYSKLSPLTFTEIYKKCSRPRD